MGNKEYKNAHHSLPLTDMKTKVKSGQKGGNILGGEVSGYSS